MKKTEIIHVDNNTSGYLNINFVLYKTRISSKYKNRKPYKPLDLKVILSHIPGTVIDILVSRGQTVKIGDDLLIIDAMKMQNFIKSNIEGKVKSVEVSRGCRVAKGTIMIRME
jgi:biotin carboxyl carrier protein